MKDGAQATPVVADGRIVPVEGAFELVLSTRVDDVTETRAVRAPLCAALAEAGAVLIALALDSRSEDDPRRTHDAPKSGDAIDGEPTAVANEPARIADKPSPTARSTAAPRDAAPGVPRKLQLGVGLAPTVDLGTLPRASTGLWGHADVHFGRLRAGVQGTAWLRQSPTFGGGGTAGASFDVLQAGLFGCFMTPLWRLTVGPCADLQANYIQVAGFGIRNPARQETVWPSVGAGLLADWRFGRFGLFARSDLVLSLAAPTFALATSAGGGMSLYSPEIVAVRAAFGVEIVVP